MSTSVTAHWKWGDHAAGGCFLFSSAVYHHHHHHHHCVTSLGRSVAPCPRLMAIDQLEKRRSPNGFAPASCCISTSDEVVDQVMHRRLSDCEQMLVNTNTEMRVNEMTSEAEQSKQTV